jgi:hypothetical protein
VRRIVTKITTAQASMDASSWRRQYYFTSDQPLGQRYFAELAGYPMVGELIGVWLTPITSTFPPERR